MDLSRLCIHTITTRAWPFETAVKEFSSAGVKGITVWRDALHGRDIRMSGKLARDHGLEIVSLCRGGFFPSTDTSKRKAAIDDNKRAIEEAAELGAPLVVLVCGSAPDQPLDVSRRQIHDGIAAVLPDAKAANVKLAIEPLHPMYADTRSAINTLAQANDLAEDLNQPDQQAGSPYVGVAVDVYHLWWDPHLEAEIKRCGKNQNLFAFHISDWTVPTKDLLNDRGLMGEGCIPIRQIRNWVEATGFKGYNEVEIFSNHWWSQDQSFFLQKIINAYREKS
jgi:sugar phosphate isomerase/epimerase